MTPEFALSAPIEAGDAANLPLLAGPRGDEDNFEDEEIEDEFDDDDLDEDDEFDDDEDDEEDEDDGPPRRRR
jgi:hypothetical protein